MLPVEPRLKPLGATMLHYADDREAKTEFKRCHSFSGYIPYALSDAATDCKSECSWEEASTCNVVWPDTDDEAPPGPTEAVTPEPASTTTVGGKVIVGFGRALQAAVKDMDGRLHALEFTGLDLGWFVGKLSENAMLFQFLGCPTIFWNRCNRLIPRFVGMAFAYQSFFDCGGCAMDLDDFIWGLHQNAGTPPVCFVYAFIYICRMSETQMEVLSERTVHRLLLAAVTIAAKMQQPQSFNVHLYAQVGHITVEELQHLEANLLELMQWNVLVCHKSFRRIFRLLIRASDAA
eukprot:Skav203612  [mRNA]  locus=scaffold935:434396:436348:+ [translate_table: standard]